MTKLRNKFATLLGTSLPPVRGLLPLLGGLLVWELIHPVNSPYFPPPSAWFASLAELARSGVLWPALGETLGTFLFSLCAATLIGAAIGITIGMSPFASRAMAPTLEFCRAVPPPVVVPVAVLLVGYNEYLKLLVVVWAAVWPILLNTAASAQLINPLLRDAAKTLQLSQNATMVKVILPSVVPALLIGLRVAVPLTIIVTLLVEMMTLIDGVGSLIVTAQRSFQSARVYGLLVIVGLMGLVINNAFLLVETLIMSRWPPRAD